MSERAESGEADELSRARHRRRRNGGASALLGFALVSAGVAFLLQALDVWTVRGDVVWPLILIVLGAWILLRRLWPGSSDGM